MTKEGQRRLLGTLAAVGPPVCALAWLIAPSMQPGYNPWREDLSTLAALDAAHPWITITGELLLAVAVLALARGLAISLTGPDVIVAVCLLVSGGLGILVQAVAREDCGTQVAACAARLHAGHASWHHTLHDATSALAFITVLAAPLVLGRPFRHHPHWCQLTNPCLITAALGVALLISYASTADGAWAGLTERIFLTVPLAWISLTGIRLARAPGTTIGQVT